MPLEATRHTPAGAKAFAQFFIKTIDWGYATTSSTYMRHYFVETCNQCRNVELFLNTAAAKGDHYIGGRITVLDASARNGSAAQSADSDVDMHVDITSSEVVDEYGHSKNRDIAYRSLGETAALKWTPGNVWVVVDLRPRK
jgi:hypothetical protein